MVMAIRSKSVKFLSLILILQALGLLAISRKEHLPTAIPLEALPASFGEWHMIQEGVVEERVQEVLRADDSLSRVYADRGGARASFFVAYFATQRTGKAPHSPKNCLPGSGWVPSVSDTVSLKVPGRRTPITVNRYLVSRGNYKSVVLYWYMSRDRVVANEYRAKIYLVLDSLRYHRSDTAMMRVIVPVNRNGDAEAAGRTAERFVRALFGVLPRFPQFRAS